MLRGRIQLVRAPQGVVVVGTERTDTDRRARGAENTRSREGSRNGQTAWLTLIRLRIQTYDSTANLNCVLDVKGLVTNDVSLLELIILRTAFALKSHRLREYSGRGVKLLAPPVSLGVADVCKTVTCYFQTHYSVKL